MCHQNEAVCIFYVALDTTSYDYYVKKNKTCTAGDHKQLNFKTLKRSQVALIKADTAKPLKSAPNYPELHPLINLPQLTMPLAKNFLKTALLSETTNF